MRDYELTLVLDPEVAEEEVPATVDGVSEYIVGKGGEVSEVNYWGRRKLAYPIKKLMEGNYVLVHFQLEPEGVVELASSLRRMSGILRYLVVKKEN